MIDPNQADQHLKAILAIENRILDPIDNDGDYESALDAKIAAEDCAWERLKQEGY